MKKTILSVAAVVAFGFAAKAQEIRFGIKAGPNISSYIGKDADDAEAKAGFHAGILAEFKFTDKISLQPEILYSEQGAQSEYAGFDSDGVYDEKLTSRQNYITVPIMAKYYIIPGLSVEAGPQVGFLVGSEYEFEKTYNWLGFEFTETATLDAKDFHKKVDFGAAVGAAYDMSFGLFFGARYYAGLTNIGDPEEGERESKVKNSVFQLSVGYKF